MNEREENNNFHKNIHSYLFSYMENNAFSELVRYSTQTVLLNRIESPKVIEINQKDV